ncbi:MAG: thiamine-phosphate kinase [Myxococcota bacterium]
MSRELQRIEAIRRRLERPSPEVRTGIGDDAAVLSPSSESSVLTVDVAVEGVHFRRDLCTLADAGYRAFMGAASDLAAMGAHPRAALLALILPPALTDPELLELIGGVAEASDEIGAPVVGGNLSSGGELSLTTTVVGTVAEPLLRNGARDGEGVYVTGRIGAAALGLALLRAGRAQDGDPTVEACIRRWRRPTAQIGAGRRLHGLASACIDVSDGLLQDLGHLCESSGVGAEIRADLLPLPERFDALAASVDADPLALALGSGDDYELVFTAPPGPAADTLGTRIGRITERPGVTVLDETGSPIDIGPVGYQHF